MFHRVQPAGGFFGGPGRPSPAPRAKLSAATATRPTAPPRPAPPKGFFPESVGGLATVYDRLTVPMFGGRMGYYHVHLAAGCFAEYLRGWAKVRVLLSHDNRLELASTVYDSVRVWNHAGGVAFRLRPTEGFRYRQVHADVKAGRLRHCSIGYDPIDEEWENRDGVLVRHVRRAKLTEISLLNDPAYPQTQLWCDKAYNWAAPAR